MDSELQAKARKIRDMETLSEREQELLDRLNRSTLAHEELDKDLRKAAELQVKDLEEIVLQKERPKPKPKSSRSVLSCQAGEKLDTSASHQASLPRSRLDLYKFSSDPTHAISIVDRLYLMESMLGLHEGAQGESKRRRRRHRHKRKSLNLAP